MKQVRSDSNNPFSSVQKHNIVFVKFALCFLLLGLLFHLFFSTSFNHFNSITLLQINTLPTPVAKSPVSEVGNSPDSGDPPPPPTTNESSNSGDPPEVPTTENVAEKCDIFTGNWVPDPSPPPYTNENCIMIEDHQNCMRNGRPDRGYLYWRWDPLHCELAKFNPKRFLDMMRHKSWVFIGDSILRNHVQSLGCIISQIEQPVETYHDKQHKSKIWRYNAYNFTLAAIWSPFVAKAHIFEDDNGVSKALIQLHLDKLNPVWTEQFKNYDYIVTAGGAWFLKPAIYYENDKIVGCHKCFSQNITEVGYQYAYRKVLQSIFDFFTSSSHKANIIFRTVMPEHFEYGDWDTGGICNRTIPFKEGEINMTDKQRNLRNIELEEFAKAEKLGFEKGVTVKLLDTTHVSLLRPDGHPGVYRQINPFTNTKVLNDCLHWCLPGPIDSWNSLLMEKLVNE